MSFGITIPNMGTGLIEGRLAPNQIEGIVAAYEEQFELEKALTTGSGIVQPGASDGSALREQFLDGVLQQVSFEQNDAAFMKDIPKKPVGSTTAEWSDLVAYGGWGDGFVSESGYDGNYNVTGMDDSFLRQSENVKFVADYRQISVVSSKVKNVEDPRKVAQMAATRNIISKINLALYYGRADLNTLQFNGVEAQVTNWATKFPSDSAILFDAGGRYMDKELFNDICQTSTNLYGSPSEFRSSIQVFSDIQKGLFPEARYTEGQNQGVFGGYRDKYLSPFGDIKLKYDKMLRANRPHVADGPGSDGKPRSAGTVSANSVGFNATPFTTCAAGAAGAGNFWQYANVNTDTAALGTAPALPSGGNNASRLPAGGYLYAVAVVVSGNEGLPWVYGAAAAGTTAAATTVTTTTGQVVQVVLDPSQVTGLGSTYARNRTYFRVYRANAGATSLSQFDWLMNIGCPTAGSPTGYDNGFRIPGAETGFLMTEQRNGVSAYHLGMLAPLYKTELPISAMAVQFALLFFGTPIVRIGRHHVIVRNIGKFNG